MRRVHLALFLVGFGGMGLLDALIFHVYLGWHHFLDSADQASALRADGWFAAAMTAILLAGLLLFALSLRVGVHELRLPRVVGATLAGAATLNLADAIVDHLILRLHVLRAGPDQWIVEAVWLFVNALLAALAARLLRGRRVPGQRVRRVRM